MVWGPSFRNRWRKRIRGFREARNSVSKHVVPSVQCKCWLVGDADSTAPRRRWQHLLSSDNQTDSKHVEGSLRKRRYQNTVCCPINPHTRTKKKWLYMKQLQYDDIPTVTHLIRRRWLLEESIKVYNTSRFTINTTRVGENDQYIEVVRATLHSSSSVHYCQSARYSPPIRSPGTLENRILPPPFILQNF